MTTPPLEPLYKTLLQLREQPPPDGEEFRRITGDYYAPIRAYIKENKIATFITEGSIWDVNRHNRDTHISKVRQMIKEERIKRMWRFAEIILAIAGLAVPLLIWLCD